MPRPLLEPFNHASPTGFDFWMTNHCNATEGDDNYNFFGGYGNCRPGDYRLVVWESVPESGFGPNCKYNPIAAQCRQHHHGGYDVLYANPAGSVQGFNAWGARAWHYGFNPATGGHKALMNDMWSHPGNDTRAAWFVIGIQHVNAIPTWPQGHPLGPKVTKVNNALTWTVPGYDNIPAGGRPMLLLHVNAAYFNNNLCYFCEVPNNPDMPRHSYARPLSQTWSTEAGGPNPEDSIDRGYAMSVDYDYITGDMTSYPTRIKAFGGPNTPTYVTTFSILIRGADSMLGAIGASHLMGGPVPV
jgi:hypothetical protein